MSSIDERVVEMKFQNSSFESGVKKTLASLLGLKDALKLNGATKGLDDVSAAANKFSLAGMQQSVQGMASHFSAMSVAAIAALGAIAVKAVNVGVQLAKSFTADPIKAGLQEYETNLNSIQTILANTSMKGTGLKEVNAALDELNTYSDKTIYNFSQMARNIGTFTAAGVDLKTSTAAIKGIANLAAVSGSSADQASTAMYQLSQAMASGTVKLMDWNSVVNAGMGGEVFQNALKDTARTQGVAIDDIIKKNGSFRDSLQEGWLTSDILTKTLSKFTGDLTAEQLKAQGYTDDQVKSILELGKTATEAATKIKTMSQLVGTLQETMGSGWAKTFQLLFGDFGEAKTLFTSINDVIGGMIGRSADARNKMLSDWKELGGRDALIKGLANTFKFLGEVIKPIKEAFRDIFPAMTGQRLAELSKNFEAFTQKLKMGEGTAAKIKSTFAGVFALFDIGIQIISAIAGAVVRFVSGLAKGSGGILDFTAGIGDYIVGVDKMLKKTNGISDFLNHFVDMLLKGVGVIKDFAGSIKDMIGGMSAGDALGGFADKVQSRFQPLTALGGVVAAVWSRVMDVLGAVWKIVGPFARQVGDAFSQLGQAIVNSISTGDFNGILDAINTGLFAGLVLILRKFMSNGINIDFGGGFLENAKKALEGVTGTLQAMQQNLKADTLLKIASAIGILAISVVALSLVDSGKLTASLVAITVMFTQLSAALFALDKATSTFGAVKIAILAGALILLAAAVDVLAISVIALSNLSWGELVKGLTGVLVLIGGLVGAANLMPSSNAKMISTGVGLVAVALAIKVLASAVKDFAEMDTGSMIKGLIGVGAALGALTLFTRLADLDKVGLAKGAGLILMAAALKVMASAVQDFGNTDWGVLGKGFLAMGVALGIVVVAMNLLPPNMLVSAAGLAIVAGSLLLIGDALKKMGGMSWEEIAKGLITLAGSLLIIAVAMIAMTEALPGAAALLVVAASFAILTPVLIALGGMSWEEIGKGLLMLAASLAILGVAGLLLTPVIPSLIGLGVAIALIGVGAAAVGVGLMAFSVGLSTLSVAGAGAAVALTAIFTAIINLIPQAMAAFGRGLVELAQIIAGAGPQMTAAATTLIMSILNAINNVAPKIIDTMINLAFKMLRAIADNIGRFVQAGSDIIVGFLNGIANNIGRVVTAATDVVVKFLQAIQQNNGRITQEGVQTIISFVNGLTSAINNNTAQMRQAGLNLAGAIINGMTGGLASGVGSVISAAKNMAKSAFDSAMSFLQAHSPSRLFMKVGGYIPQGMAIGIDQYSSAVVNSTESMGLDAINSMRKTISGISDLVGEHLDATPVITPVLDLSQVVRDSSALGGILRTAPISVGSTYSSAADAANGYAIRTKITESSATTSQPGATLSFVQNNNSPKAISQADIYRQTKNQLSVVKGVLDNAH